jgi:GPI mannosyltransferase 3
LASDDESNAAAALLVASLRANGCERAGARRFRPGPILVDRQTRPPRHWRPREEGGTVTIACDLPRDAMTRRAAAVLCGLLALAFAVRAVVVFGTPYMVHPDEIFQVYEQAHRLVFGSGLVPWEFHDGARSWLVPGILAGIMAVSRRFGSDPQDYLIPIRLLCSVLSLTVVYVGFRVALRRDGLAGAALTGTLAAVWLDAVYFAPSVMAEVLASYGAVGAIALADGRHEDGWTAALIGALLGLALALRPQYGPALVVVALWHGRFEWRRRWAPMLGGGLAVVVLDLGVLDFLTWGSPFHSIWHYLLRGFFEGFANQAGKAPLLHYAHFLAWYWTYPAVPLGLLMLIGMVRAPLVGAVAAAIFLSHSVIAHKEYRYICLALLLAPILIGLGANFLIAAARRWIGTIGSAAAGAAVVLYAALVSWYAWNYGLLFLRSPRGDLRAVLAAHREPQLCGLAVLDEAWSAMGGYTFLDRDAPVYYSDMPTFVAMTKTVTIPATVVLHNAPLANFPGKELLHQTQAFNFVIASADRAVPGYGRVQCFNNGPRRTPRKVCLFERPGPCR